MKAGTVGLAALVAACALSGLVPATAGGTSQVATSTEGAYAWGSLDMAQFPDGQARSIAVVMGIPGGVVTGSPALGGVDLARPWAALRIGTYANSLGLVGNGGCGTVSNPSSWSGPRAEGRTFVGMQAVVQCAGDPIYSSYAIRFEPAVEWGRPSPAYRFGVPEVNTEYFGWSEPFAVNGNLVTEVRTVQKSRLSLCGTRHDGRVDCYGGKNALANVYPDARAMTAELHSAGI